MFSRTSLSLYVTFGMFSILAAAKQWTYQIIHPVTTTITVTATATTTEPASQCNSGPVQCCNTVVPATDPSAKKLLGLIGLILTDANVPVGLTCTPITVVGAGSAASCDKQPVCCENNNFNGFINIGCTPVDISL